MIKSIKLIPMALAAMLALGCSATNQAKKPVDITPVVTKTEKTVVYACQSKKKVTAFYQFENKMPVSASVAVGKKVVAKDLPFDAKNQDFSSFVSDNYIWNVDTGFNLDTISKTPALMLTQKGKSVDKILAKDCSVTSVK